jgi:hypothetical protein
MSSFDVSLGDKVDAYNIVMTRLEAATDYWNGRANELYKIAKATSNARSRIREALKGAMMAMGKEEITGAEVRFKLARSKPSLIVDEVNVPESFKIIVTTKSVDKERVRTALEEGFEVEGAQLVPSFSLRQYAAKGIK